MASTSPLGGLHSGGGSVPRIYRAGALSSIGLAISAPPIEFSSTGKKSPKPILRAHGRALSQEPHAGETWQLPRFGRMSYENVVAAPIPRKKPWCFLPTMV